METTQKDVLVFKDQAGECYVLPQAVLEWGRVPAEHTAAVERLIAEAGGEDVQGHSYYIRLLSPKLVSLLDRIPRYLTSSISVADMEAAFDGGSTYYGDGNR